MARDPRGREWRRLAFEQNAQHSAQRLGGTPEQLVAYRKGCKVGTAFFEGKLAHTSDRHLERAAYRRRGELTQACLALVRNDPHPGIRLGEYLLDFVDRQIAPEFDGERLAVATHRADANADSVDRDGICFTAEDLVAFGLTFPFFATLAVAEILIDPRQQAARKRKTELLAWQGFIPQRRGHRSVQLED